MKLNLYILLTCIICITNSYGCNITNSQKINGNGTINNPYQIYSEIQFINFAKSFPQNSSYIQCRDLDFSNINFVGFGNLTNPYEGEYNGNSYIIRNYAFNYKNKQITEYVGLFRVTSGATIRNIIIDIKINNTNRFGVVQNLRYVGALIGFSNGKNNGSTIKPTIIDNTYIKTDVITANDFYCGIFGRMNYTNIYNSIFITKNIISSHSDGVNSISCYIANSIIRNIYINAKLLYLDNQMIFDSSISYCSAGFGVIKNSTLENILYKFNVELPEIDILPPINIGGFSSSLYFTNISNIIFTGDFILDNKLFNTQIGNTNLSIGYVAGSDYYSNFGQNIYYVNIKKN